MDPSKIKVTSKMGSSSTAFVVDHKNSSLVSSNFHHNPTLNSNEINSHNRYSYPDIVTSLPSSSLNYADLLQTWNYHRILTSRLPIDQLSDNSPRDYYTPNDYFQQYSPCSFQKSLSHQTHDEILLKKFHPDTLVNLDTGESKTIQELTRHDLLKSAKQSCQYSSVLARVDFIGTADKSTGKVELRFYVNDAGKMASCYVLPAVPFFAHEHSCWSSISPEQTRRTCGLKCRQLVCGDIIIAIAEQRKSLSSSKINDKPEHNQQKQTKSTLTRYAKTPISSSNKRYKASNE